MSSISQHYALRARMIEWENGRKVIREYLLPWMITTTLSLIRLLHFASVFLFVLIYKWFTMKCAEESEKEKWGEWRLRLYSFTLAQHDIFQSVSLSLSNYSSRYIFLQEARDKWYYHSLFHSLSPLQCEGINVEQVIPWSYCSLNVYIRRLPFNSIYFHSLLFNLQVINSLFSIVSIHSIDKALISFYMYICICDRIIAWFTFIVRSSSGTRAIIQWNYVQPIQRMLC